MKHLGEEVKRELGRFGPEGGISELVEAWPAAVGETIARSAWPARVARDGTLHVNTADSIWAFELTSRAGEIAERLGVERVRFAPGRLPEAEDSGPEGPESHPGNGTNGQPATPAGGAGSMRPAGQRPISGRRSRSEPPMEAPAPPRLRSRWPGCGR